MKRWKMRVPGSTANLGTGFDSIGLAIDRYLTLDIHWANDWNFSYVTPGHEMLPNGKANLIYKTLVYTLNHWDVEADDRACHVTIESELPLARGLGSSAAAIVAGIELANILYELRLTSEEKVRVASLLEGHPDNAAASVYGGLTIGTHDDTETVVLPCGSIDVDLICVVPDEQLLTEASRQVLPEYMNFRKAIKGSSLANVMVAALLRGDYEKAGEMMIRDVFHQPYRHSLVPHLLPLIEFASERHIYGVALSGAGPAVMCYVKKGTGPAILSDLQHAFNRYEMELLQIDREGVMVERIE
ncbi:homoserine kinase [Pullulanibacillus camelliae]|uniref:Homoserine kinase n=1 Tax=Pullulanibacillus camelliae TaxID=1707096 RepID=A0A8J2VNG2_9BACL|nr:homoserine kinase [Pullulanibacillus camelliae]GGE40514.1 homoserine kinase [Pullulanibacillus camelliae]